MKKRTLTFVILGLIFVGFIGVTIQSILSALNVTINNNQAVGSVFIAFIGLHLIILIVEIVSIFKIDDSTFHTALLAACLLLLYLFSTDTPLFLSNFGITISKTIFGIISEIIFVLALICCCWYVLYLYNITVNKTRIITVICLILSLLILYSITFKYGYGYIIHFILASLMTIMFCLILYKAKMKNNIGLTTYLSATIFCLCVGTQNVNALTYNGIFAPVLGISLAYAVASFSVFLIVYLMFSIRTDSKAVKSNEYKLQAESFETKALSNQIKPHFIFNSLETIRALYHEDITDGDKALNLLSEFLRRSINSFDNNLVPFETELDNVFTYTEFQNLKYRNKIEIIFNIDFTDFSVPPFSIQPFVENALKHSGVNEIENGFIIISSYKKDNFAIVEITDNGKGFDVSKISNASHGIKNACGRFSLAFGILPEIESVIGSGTHVKIKIDLTKEKENIR